MDLKKAELTAIALAADAASLARDMLFTADLLKDAEPNKAELALRLQVARMYVNSLRNHMDQLSEAFPHTARKEK